MCPNEKKTIPSTIAVVRLSEYKKSLLSESTELTLVDFFLVLTGKEPCVTNTDGRARLDIISVVKDSYHELLKDFSQKNCWRTFRISETLDDYVNEGAGLFSVSELEDLKMKERVLAERNERGYYRSKDRHPNTYKITSEAYQKYITHEHLQMLHHPWSTQPNEALNRSVSAFAPKDRTFSKTESLRTRIDIAGAIRNVGNEEFIRRIFSKLGLNFDPNLKKFLRSIDIRRLKHKTRAATKEGKSKRSKARYDKLSNAMQSHIRDQKTVWSIKRVLQLGKQPRLQSTYPTPKAKTLQEHQRRH